MVIGGLVSATLLTLVVLPAIYPYAARLRLPFLPEAESQPEPEPEPYRRRSRM